MTRDEAVAALMAATYLTHEGALLVLSRLEARGATIYKKKVLKNGRRPASSEPLTPALASRIRVYFRRHPSATQQQIANVFNVNIGRVNEALSRKRI